MLAYERGKGLSPGLLQSLNQVDNISLKSSGETMNYSLGVDIGGTKIATGLIDKNGNYSYREEFPSITTDREAMFQQVARCIREVLKKSSLSIYDLEGIGVGVPGKVDIKNGVAEFQNNLPWTSFPLVQRIKEQFPVEKVIIDNDVYLATFAEWVINGKNGKETFVYFTISTGVSCCTIHNGNFVRGAGFAGEIGFLPVAYDQVAGEYKSLEEVASGPGMARLASERKSSLGLDENAAILDSNKVLMDFKKGDPYAVSVMNDVFDYIARSLYTVSCLLDPDKLILGGGVINHHPDLLDPIKNALRKYLIPKQMGILNRLNVSRLKGNAGLIGAGLKVRLCMEDLNQGRNNE